MAAAAPGARHARLPSATDVIPHQKHRADATLARVSCSAPPDVPAWDQPPDLRSVPLVGGDTVALGAPIPPGRIGRFNVTAYLTDPRLKGTVPAEHRRTGRADTASALPR